MIDLHSHTFFSDGALGPAELLRRAEYAGYKAMAITDHCDSSNLNIIPDIVRLCKDISENCNIRAIPGIELTHVPPKLISGMTGEARKLGAKVVIVHGETLVEPVCEGTNLAAIESHVDILAHPGLITEDEVRLAKENNVYLEISARKGHSLANGHVASLAMKIGAGFLVNSDAHGPGDIMDMEFAKRVALGAGLGEAGFNAAMFNAGELLEKVI